MKTSDFDYHLPESSIAQTPAEPRHDSSLVAPNKLTVYNIRYDARHSF